MLEMISWQKFNYFVTRYICGGAVLDGSHIVTAAHCVKSLFPEELTVRVGDWDASADIEVAGRGY